MKLGRAVVVERQALVLQNRHHTLFIGDYGRFKHASLPVASGKRTIIAAFTMQQVQKYVDRVLRARAGGD